MESGDASDEEAPPSNKKEKISQEMRLISMLVAMKTEDGLK